MGKPYASELKLLADTYSWSMSVDIEPWANIIASIAPYPLLTVGSGGSYTTAHLVSTLHQYFTGRIAKATTPLEIISSLPDIKDLAVLFLSAGGKNADIIGAFQKVATYEPRRLVVMCSKKKSPLVEMAQSYKYVDLLDFDLPSGKDGFLATNSLLAFSILLTRLYIKVFSSAVQLPNTLAELVYPFFNGDETEFIFKLRQDCSLLWQRDTLLVLHGNTTRSAALDMESKFSEAALGTIQIADYRNFAHGRHHWLAKRGATTSVLALITDDDRELAKKTIHLIPNEIPIVCIDIPLAGLSANLAMLISLLYVVGLAGEARGIDPGRPGVPPFGQQLYNLRAITKVFQSNNLLSALESIAIERKTGVSMEALQRNNEIDYWREAYETFIKNLKSASFQSIVFDYDDTLCDRHNRYTGLDKITVQQIERLLEAGILIGIATGRGKSIKQDLEQQLRPEFWPQVVIGFYNGAFINQLGEDLHPDASSEPCESLKSVAEAFRSNSRLAKLAKVEYRHKQITVIPNLLVPDGIVWDIVQQVTMQFSKQAISVLRSGHSIDVLASGVSKRSVLTRVKEMIGKQGNASVICIGDRGRWPGNDFWLLSEPLSLSVDEVSSDPTTCWNIASPGYRGIQGTNEYLQALSIKNHSLVIDIKKIGSRKTK